MDNIIELSPPSEQHRPVNFKRMVFFLGVRYTVHVRDEIIATDKFDTKLIKELTQLTGITPNDVRWKTKAQLNATVFV